MQTGFFVNVYLFMTLREKQHILEQIRVLIGEAPPQKSFSTWGHAPKWQFEVVLLEQRYTLMFTTHVTLKQRGGGGFFIVRYDTVMIRIRLGFYPILPLWFDHALFILRGCYCPYCHTLQNHFSSIFREQINRAAEVYYFSLRCWVRLRRLTNTHQSSSPVVFSDRSMFVCTWLTVRCPTCEHNSLLERERAVMCVKLACPLSCLLALALRWQASLWPLICHTALSSSIVFLEDVDCGLMVNYTESL